MSERKVRMGIDVGGTHTKAVAIDNATHEIIGKSSVKTTHDDKAGVATGVVQAFKNCLKENNIDPKDVIFVAHSTTQATNALIEGDVAQVGVIGIGGKGPGGWIAKAQTNLKDIDLGSGRSIHLHNRYLVDDTLSDASVKAAIQELTGEGAQVIVASEVYGVDDMENETGVCGIAKQMGLEATAASEITKLYGLTRRTRTAAINASILPKMLNTANETEESVRSAGVEVPLMIMRGDGGVMEISEMKKRPVLTMLSGPAASVMGSLMYLRASNGVYFEVGGTTTNIGVIKDGRPAIDYSIVGGHRTYISSLDVRVLGVAGGSMVRADKSGVKDVGPRSAHIAGMDYAVFTPEEEIVDPKVIFFSPMKTLEPKRAENKAEKAAVNGSAEDATVSAPSVQIDLSKVKIEPLFADDVDFETFSKSDFRVVKIEACEAVPKSKKLLKFTLNDGTDRKRTILSGIHEYYEPEELVGKTCVAITNLPPRKMMGIDSEGMLISAVYEYDGREGLNLLMLDDSIPAGAKLY